MIVAWQSGGKRQIGRERKHVEKDVAVLRIS